VCSAGARACSPAAAGTTLCSGLCRDLQTDRANCGACGNACAARANASPTCASSACSYACNAGSADCNLSASDGCEVNVLGDPAHCGRCNNACPRPDGASAAVCSNGACGFTCATNRGDCDTNRANGCETDTGTSTTHCGACGRACGAGQVCTNGACTVSTQGCSGNAAFSYEIVPGLWACVHTANITSYPQNSGMCAAGYTPPTFALVNSLGLRMPNTDETTAFFTWYRGRATSGDTNYIRTYQKRRGGCTLEAHGDLYVSSFNPNSSSGGWRDLYLNGGSCNLQTDSANNVSGHPLAGTLCVRGTYVPPAP
jgi:hypothetical protein